MTDDENKEDLLLRLTMPGKKLRESTINKIKIAEEKANISTTPSTQEQPIEPELNYEIEQQSLELLEEPKEEVPQDVQKSLTQTDFNQSIQEENNTEIKELQQNTIEENPIQKIEEFRQITQEQIDSPPQETIMPPEIKQEVIEKPLIQETHLEQSTQEENKELLDKITMPSQKNNQMNPEKDNNEETIKDPHIYKQGHPHIGSSYDMDTITNLTNRIYNTDEAVNKLKKK